VEKPGRNSSAQEKAKRQGFLDAVQAQQGGAFLPEELLLNTPIRRENAPAVVEPLDSPRHLTWLLLRDPHGLNEQEQHMLTFMCQLPALETTYLLAQQFFTMVRERHAEQLDGWLEECLTSDIPDIRTFAEGLKREYSALKGALTFAYSNGPIEGQINKLKYIKRSMYGRGSFELLRQRFLQAA
jgi:transposase